MCVCVYIRSRCVSPAPQVIHCHILQHEDQGMMKVLQITGTEGTRWANAENIDPTCHRGATVASPTITTQVTCTVGPKPPPASPAPPSPPPSSPPPPASPASPSPPPSSPPSPSPPPPPPDETSNSFLDSCCN